MKVLMINIDRSIFAPGSKSLERLKEYANFCERFWVIVMINQKHEPIKEEGLEIYATASERKINYSRDALKIATGIVKNGKPDMVVTQDVFDTGHVGWLIKRKFKIPWQAQVHTDFLSPYFKRESLLNKARVTAAKFLIHRADSFRVVSERIKKSLVKLGVAEEKIFVLPIFVDVKKFIDAPIKSDLRQKYPQFDFTILMASRLTKEKNISLAIEAIEEIVKKYQKVGLIITGEGSEKNRLMLKTKNRRLETNIIFEPWSDDLISYYKSADLFLLTSNYEGWGMTVIEAAACGCPILMTDTGCAGEMIKNNESGIIIPVGDKDKLTEALFMLLEKPELRKKLGQQAKEAVTHLSNRQEFFDKYKKIWEISMGQNKNT